MSPDLFTHSVSYFAEAPLSHHNPSRVQLFVYSCVGKPDIKTARLQAQVGRQQGNRGLTAFVRVQPCLWFCMCRDVLCCMLSRGLLNHVSHVCSTCWSMLQGLPAMHVSHALSCPAIHARENHSRALSSPHTRPKGFDTLCPLRVHMHWAVLHTGGCCWWHLAGCCAAVRACVGAAGAAG
jgi:hypothetical protein